MTACDHEDVKNEFGIVVAAHVSTGEILDVFHQHCELTSMWDSSDDCLLLALERDDGRGTVSLSPLRLQRESGLVNEVSMSWMAAPLPIMVRSAVHYYRSLLGL